MAAGVSSSVVSISDRAALQILAVPRLPRGVLPLRARAARTPNLVMSLRSTSFRRRSPAVAGAAVASAAADEDSTDKSVKHRSTRERLTAFVDQQAGYLWLLGPVVATSAVVVPALTFSLVELLQSNYWFGLGAVFGLDLAYILAADAFFVLSDKLGHHQNIPGKPSPWIGPWKYTGYPKGLPHVLDYVSYVGIGVAVLGLIFSIFLGKFGAAVAGFVPYIGLILVQAAYERLLCKDKLPTYPMVAVVYTVYRFKQLARAMELFAVFGGGSVLLSMVRFLMAAWTFYLATYLAQLPWLYCSWNANRLT